MNSPAAAPPGAEPNLDLALIGNCAIGALVDRRGAIVWCCMPRFDGDPVFHALLAEDARGWQDERRARRLEPGRAELRARHRDRPDPPARCRRTGRGDHRLRAALLPSRPGLPPGAAGSPDPPAGRACAHPHQRQAARRVGPREADDHARQQSPALRASERHAAADDERAADLCRRRHLVLAALAGEPAVRSRRDAVRRHRRDRPGIRGADLPLLALLDASPRRSRWSGRRR